MEPTRDVIAEGAPPSPAASPLPSAGSDDGEPIDGLATPAGAAPQSEPTPVGGASDEVGEAGEDTDDDLGEDGFADSQPVEPAELSAARQADEAVTGGGDAADDAKGPAASGISQQLNQSTAGAVVGNARDIYVNGEPVKPTIRRLPDTAVGRYRDLFEPPAAFDEEVSHLTATRGGVLLVYGEDGAGKLCFAVNVAARLAELAGCEPSVWLYERRLAEAEPLFAVLAKQKLGRPACVIVEDVFDRGIALGDLEPPGLDAHTARLADAGLWLILTTEAPAAFLAGVPAPRLHASPEFMQTIFARHLAWYVSACRVPEAVASFARDNWESLHEKLRRPALIESFCESLAKVLPHSEAALLELAERVTTNGRDALRAAFRRLDPGAQLFAMLVLLFHGWERRRIEETFLASVDHLRAGGLTWLKDPARRGLDDLLLAVRAHESAGRLEFDDPLFEDTVEEQLANRRHLLWPLVEALAGGSLIPCGDKQHAGARRALGQAAGMLASHDPARFGRLLDELAADRGRREIALRAMEQAIARDYETASAPLLATVLGWMREGGDERLRVAAFALGRMHQAIGRLAAKQELPKGWSRRLAELERALREVASRGAHNTRRAVASTAVKMNGVDPRGSVSLLRSWLRSGDKPVRQAGRAAVAAIFEALPVRRPAARVERFGVVLGLIEPLLETAGDDSPHVVTVFTGLRKLFAAEGTWPAPIAAALLEIANHASCRARQRLRAALARVWGDGGGTAHQLAQAVAARSHAMDGLLMDRPNGGRGVLVIDPAFLALDGREAGGAAGGDGGPRRAACSYLISLLASQMELAVTYLGTPEPPAAQPAAAGAPAPAAAVLPPAPLHPVPGLLMPALAPWQGEDLSLVAAIGSAPLLDLEDASARRPRIHRLVVVAVGPPPPAIPAIPGVECAPLDEAASTQGVRALEEWLSQRWAGDLATAEPAAWGSTLADLGVDVRALAADAEPLLALWTETLDDAAGAGAARLDVARRTLCGLAWYAAWDLDRCVELLRSWLDPASASPRPAEEGSDASPQPAEEGSDASPQPAEEGSDGTRRRRAAMAAAGARMLFAMHSARGVPAGESAPGVLFDALAAPLAARDRDGTEAVLAAVWRWLADPVWADYLAGDVRDGRGRLLRWAERFTPDQLEALHAALPPPDVPFDEQLAADTRERVAALADRLRERILRGEPVPLPALGDGEHHVLIVFDAAEPDAARRRRQADLAAELFAAVARNPQAVPVIYRLGETRPAWAGRGLPTAGEHLLRAASPAPRLLVPLLANPALSPQRVRRLLVLAARPALDAEDLLAGPWRPLLVYCGGKAAAQAQPWFAEVPPPVGESAAAIAHHLHLA